MHPAPKLILIADAEADEARLLSERVALETDYDTLAVRDDGETLRQVERRLPDAAIFGADVPRLNAREAARWLRERFGEQRPLLIAITGDSADELNFSGLFDHVLKRPVDLRRLLPMLAQA